MHIKIGIFCLLGVLFFAYGFAGDLGLGDVQVRVCEFQNETSAKSASLYTKAGKKTDVCLEIINLSENEGYVELAFVEQTSTSGDNEDIACLLQGEAEDRFAPYVLPTWTGSIFLKPQSFEKKTFQINFPLGFQGMQKGCIVYSVSSKQAETSEGANISFVTRKASIINIFVDSPQKIKSIIDFFVPSGKSNVLNIGFSPFKFLFQEKDAKMILKLGMKNQGDLDQTVSFSGYFRPLWSKKKIYFSGGVWIINQSQSLSSGITTSMPSYYLGVFVNKTFFHTEPYFRFEPLNIPSELLQGENFSKQSFLIILSWPFFVFIIFIILVLFLLRLIIRKNKKSSH